MINTDAIIFAWENIYVDVSTYETAMVCIPLMEQSEEFFDLRLFFKEMAINIQLDQNENCDYFAKIINYLKR